MGSLRSPPSSATPPSSTEFSAASYRVYASFCYKNDSNWLECYDPSSNTWCRVSPVPGLIDDHALRDFAMVALGDWIYIIGGRLCHKYKPSPVSDESEELTIRDIGVTFKVLRYNVRLNQWSECAPLGVPRYDFACAISENKIYVAGGKSNVVSAVGISSAEVYDPSIDMWVPLPNMSTLRYKCVGVTWQGKMHVVGGFAVRADSDTMVSHGIERSSAEVYDTQAGKWDLVARMWQLDVPPNQIVAVGERLLSSGDCFKTWKGHIDTYDGQLNIWNVVDGSHLKTLNSPIFASCDDLSQIQLLYLTMAPVGPHLYFLAGYRVVGSAPRTISMVHIFDTSVTSHAWKSFEPMEDQVEKMLCTHCCVVQIS